MMQAALSPLNQRELRKLILSIRANADQLNLFLAICDDHNLQETLIQRYEAELSQQGFATYRTRLELKQPSLKATLAALVEQKTNLQTGEKAVVTVLGGTDLLGVRLNQDTSEQEKFFFSLQWTRESLLEFKFPVVLWLSNGVATKLSQQAPDFWSWRSGVFEFEVEPRFVVPPDQKPDQISSLLIDSETRQAGSIPDLQQQIAELVQQSSQSPLLVTLYNDLGDAYQQTSAHEPALQAYEQALHLAQTLKDQAGQGRSLLNLGNTLYNCERFSQAITFYQQALAVFKAIGDRDNEAQSLFRLGLVYDSLSEYQTAIDYYQQALAITREIQDRQNEEIALGHLGATYYALGEYRTAIDYYQQALEIARKIQDRQRKGTVLRSLGVTYYALGEYQTAINYYQEALAVARKIQDRQNEELALGHLGHAYYALGEYQTAISYYQQVLAIAREIQNRQSEELALGCLGDAYYSLGKHQIAIDYYQQALVIAREVQDHQGEGILLGSLGSTYNALGNYRTAIDYYQQTATNAREEGDRPGEEAAFRSLGNAYSAMGDFQAAGDYHRLANALRLGDRRDEANAWFNLGTTQERLKQPSQAKQSYANARLLYQQLGLDEKVQDCDQKIQKYER